MDKQQADQILRIAIALESIVEQLKKLNATHESQAKDLIQTVACISQVMEDQAQV